MAELHETRLTLRFFGDDLDPDEVTARLGLPPSVGVRKGGIWRTRNGTEKVARTGSWRLEAEDRTPGDLDGQISELLGALNDNLSVWQELTARFEADIFCGLFMREGNEGISLHPDTMMKLGKRNLSLDFDLYGPD